MTSSTSSTQPCPFPFRCADSCHPREGIRVPPPPAPIRPIVQVLIDVEGWPQAGGILRVSLPTSSVLVPREGSSASATSTVPATSPDRPDGTRGGPLSPADAALPDAMRDGEGKKDGDQLRQPSFQRSISREHYVARFPTSYLTPISLSCDLPADYPTSAAPQVCLFHSPTKLSLIYFLPVMKAYPLKHRSSVSPTCDEGLNAISLSSHAVHTVPPLVMRA